MRSNQRATVPVTEPAHETGTVGVAAAAVAIVEQRPRRPTPIGRFFVTGRSTVNLKRQLQRALSGNRGRKHSS